MSKEKISTDWKDYFEFPLKLNSDNVYTKNSEMAFDFIPSFITSVNAFRISNNDKEKLVRIINGSNETIKTNLNLNCKNGTIYVDNLEFIWIRSWGRLTGTGDGLGLSSMIATKIQNSFADFIINKIKSSYKNNEDLL